MAHYLVLNHLKGAQEEEAAAAAEHASPAANKAAAAESTPAPATPPRDGALPPSFSLDRVDCCFLGVAVLLPCRSLHGSRSGSLDLLVLG